MAAITLAIDYMVGQVGVGSKFCRLDYVISGWLPSLQRNGESMNDFKTSDSHGNRVRFSASNATFLLSLPIHYSWTSKTKKHESKINFQ